MKGIRLQLSLSLHAASFFSRQHSFRAHFQHQKIEKGFKVMIGISENIPHPAFSLWLIHTTHLASFDHFFCSDEDERNSRKFQLSELNFSRNAQRSLNIELVNESMLENWAMKACLCRLWTMFHLNLSHASYRVLTERGRRVRMSCWGSNRSVEIVFTWTFMGKLLTALGKGL